MYSTAFVSSRLLHFRFRIPEYSGSISSHWLSVKSVGYGLRPALTSFMLLLYHVLLMMTSSYRYKIHSHAYHSIAVYPIHMEHSFHLSARGSTGSVLHMRSRILWKRFLQASNQHVEHQPKILNTVPTPNLSLSSAGLPTPFSMATSQFRVRNRHGSFPQSSRAPTTGCSGSSDPHVSPAQGSRHSPWYHLSAAAPHTTLFDEAPMKALRHQEHPVPSVVHQQSLDTNELTNDRFVNAIVLLPAADE